MLSGKLLADALSEYALISHLVRHTTPEEVCQAAGEILGARAEPSPGLFDLFARIQEYDAVYAGLSGEKRDGFVNLVRYALVPFPGFREAVFSQKLPRESRTVRGRESGSNSSENREKPKRAVALAPFERPFSNVELIKDSGLIPWLLHKNHGMEVSMVSAPGGPYPYAELVKGLQFEFLRDGSLESKAAYLREQGNKIDLLILRGCHSSYFPLAPLYKEVNPTGRIYIGLDANSRWMDRFLFYVSSFQKFLDACDYIATSCSAMAKHLSVKWQRNIFCLPNGYYDFYGFPHPELSKKEKLILTVGRLGTWQKATELLLLAFGAAAEYLPDYRLKLVGSMEEEFEPWVDRFMREHPELQERILFTGPIEDRRLLHEEFERAEIFALPSRLEGGAPNVIGEALNSGCAVAVTKIDAWEDITAGGQCGLVSEIDDVEGFAENLIRLSRGDRQKLFSAAIKQGREFYSMEKQVESLYGML